MEINIRYMVYKKVVITNLVQMFCIRDFSSCWFNLGVPRNCT